MPTTEHNILPLTGRAPSEDPVPLHAAAYKEKNVIGKRLTEARIASGLSQREVSSRLLRYGIDITAAAVSRWEKGASQPNTFQLLVLCELYHIEEPYAFFTGRSPEVTDYSPELSRKGLNLLHTIKEALIASGQYAPHSGRRTAPAAQPIELIPMRISRNVASAGTGQLLEDGAFELLDFPASQIPDGAELGIRISGNSMEPYYSDGQIVWVETCSELSPGEVGIFILEGEGYIKQYREELPEGEEAGDYTFDGVLRPKIYLHSFHPDYPDRPVTSEDFRICGRVLN